MAAYWDKNWDDDEWLKRQSAVTLHYIYEQAQTGGRNTARVTAIMSSRLEKIGTEKSFADVNEFSSLAYIRYMQSEETAANAAVYDEYRQGFSAVLGERLKNMFEYYHAEQHNDAGNLTKNADSFRYWNENWKLKILDMTSRLLGRTEEPEISLMIDAETKDTVLENSLRNVGSKTNKGLGSGDQTVFTRAEQLGAFAGIDEDVRQAVMNRITLNAGLQAAEDNDRALDSVALSGTATLNVYKEDGSLTPLYEDCQELADKINFSFPDNTSDTKKAELTIAYKQQLLANAAQRASQAILRDEAFLLKNKTEEDILAAYKSEVARQFGRGVVLAGLAGDEATAVMLNEITVDKDGNITYTGSKANLADAVTGILDGKNAIDPLAVNLDTYQLGQETNELSKDLKLAKINVDNLKFWTKAKKIVAAATENIIKKGGWKKIVANLAIYGSSAALMAGAAPAIAAGAALYAGWTAANAWVMPVYDSLNNEMYAGKVKGLKNRIAYLKANWKRAKDAKYAEEKFKGRAWFRTTEGLVVGGLTGGLAVGAAGGWLRTLARQGTMTTGKTVSLIKSWFGVKKAKKELDAQYSVAKYKSLQTVEGYLKQDKIALGAVVAGSLAADYIKYDMENHGPVSQLADKVMNRTEELSNPEHIVVEEEKTEVESQQIINVVRSDSLNLRQQTDSLNLSQTDSLNLRQPADSLILKQQTNDLNLNHQTDTQTSTIETVVPQTQPKVGDVLETKELSGGVVRTITKGAKYDYVQYSGLPKGEAQTSEVFQKFLEKRINNMNEYNKLVEVVDGNGEIVPMDKATEVMLGRLKDGTLQIPQGMTPEHALYVAYMKAHYYGDKHMLNLIACSEGVRKNALVDQLSKDAALFNTHAIKGVTFGTPTDGMKCIMRAGTVKTILCEGKKLVLEQRSVDPIVTPKIDASVAGADDIGAAALTNHAEIQKLSVNFRNPYAQATHVYSGSGSNYNIGLTIPEGTEYIRMNNSGVLYAWQPKGAVLDGSDVVSGAGGVETMRAVALNINMEKLGAPRIADTADNLNFQYGEGKNALKFVLDKKTGEMHTFIGKKEVILDQAATQRAGSVLNKAMVESKLDQTYHLVFGAETEQNNEHLAALADRYQGKLKNLETKYGEDIAKAVRRSSLTEPSVSSSLPPRESIAGYEDVAISSEQRAALLGDKANIAYTGNNKDGEMIFSVSGVDGIDQLHLPKLYKANLEDAPAEFKSVTEDGKTLLNVNMQTTDGTLTVAIESTSGKAAVMLNGKAVVLNPESVKQVTAITTETLQQQGMEVKNLNLTPYAKGTIGEKLLGVYKQTTATAVQTKLKGR